MSGWLIYWVIICIFRPSCKLSIPSLINNTPLPELEIDWFCVQLDSSIPYTKELSHLAAPPWEIPGERKFRIYPQSPDAQGCKQSGRQGSNWINQLCPGGTQSWTLLIWQKERCICGVPTPKETTLPDPEPSLNHGEAETITKCGCYVKMIDKTPLMINELTWLKGISPSWGRHCSKTHS